MTRSTLIRALRAQGIDVVEEAGGLVCLPLAQWLASALIAKNEGCRLVDLWAMDDAALGGTFSVVAAFALTRRPPVVLCATLPEGVERFPSLTPTFPSAARLERAIRDLLGLIPEGHPDTRPWLLHVAPGHPERFHPLRCDAAADALPPLISQRYPFLRVEGEGVHEIPVGPVHAGVIEPGHFRFQVIGEEILNLEERFGYLHRGIEKRMVGLTPVQGVKLATRQSGDAAVGMGWAFCRAVEKALAVEIPPAAVWSRALLAERERIANHVGDIGAICNDVAFSFMHMQTLKLREEMARLHLEIFGHRLLFDQVIPGGVTRVPDATQRQRLVEQTQAVAATMEQLRILMDDTPSLLTRLDGSGVVDSETAQSLGMLGYAGRASGVDADSRIAVAYAPYHLHAPEGLVLHKGDVAARVAIRFEEIAQSARLIAALVADFPVEEGAAVELPQAESGMQGFALIEGWRGEIAAFVRFGAGGRIDRARLRDPSWFNWPGLELAVLGVPVPDFPLCNKSFNCAYAGHDG